MNNAAVGGATGPTYSITSMQSANAGTYTVALGLASGDLVVSTPVTLILDTRSSSSSSSSSSGGGTGSSSGGPTNSASGGGGGGAPGLAFLAALALFGSLRLLRCRRR